MGNDYRKELFETYHSTHGTYVDLDDATKTDWFKQYVGYNYLPLFSEFDKSKVAVLEIGCNKGFALLALDRLGFKNLFGIDMSPADIQRARELVPAAKFQSGDAHPYLRKNRKKFDVILLKAVLEHIPKNEVVPFLKSIREGLREGGLVIVDVPNMDWIASHHERYMDFTHENGFTRESLGQVMRNVFASVTVEKGKPVLSKGPRGLLRDMIRPVVLGLVNLVLRLVGEGASDIWWDCRSIIAAGKK